jgi:hypothetical protein
MVLEQITTDYDQTIPQSKLKSMQSAKEIADNIAQGKMLDKTVVSPAQMKADAEEEKKKKGKLLTPKRTMEVADSLDFEARKNVYSKINKTTKIDESGNYDKYKKSVENYNLKADKEIKKNPDMINSQRYRSLALKAMNKNK